MFMVRTKLSVIYSYIAESTSDTVFSKTYKLGKIYVLGANRLT